MKAGIVSIFFLCSFWAIGFGQFKVVKIATEDIYINYYFKQKQTKRHKNDTTFFLCKAITPSMFFLEKYINGKKVCTKKYKTVVAKDSLNIMEKYLDTINRISKIYNKKALYYDAIEVRQRRQ